ncbi:MAG: tRNA (N6-threonylcarbamoyladenosine(37)-N6)-methyltransferase TrmO [Elusimicrobia bacterium]|nr:tRNA (N6-threonylcarbamoyladenosine(37)-N6)-methyltransferase TrmO [Elusimicrobiota bacterium]
MKAIGFLESCFAEKFGAPRQPGLVPAAAARLKIRKEFIPEQSLKGLGEFSHVWLLSYFHLNTNKAFKSTVHPPRLKGKTVGVFASRSPHRPSPIGLSVAKLERVSGDTLYLSGIDLVDGTPILDVKPYIRSYDYVPHSVSGWAGRAPAPTLKVVFSPKANASGKLKALLRQILRQDLRNPRDRSQLQDGREHELRLKDCVVTFEVRGKSARVLRVGSPSAKAYAKPGRVPRELL